MRLRTIFVKYNEDGFLSVAEDDIDNNLSPSQINELSEDLYAKLIDEPHNVLAGYYTLIEFGWVNSLYNTLSPLKVYCLQRLEPDVMRVQAKRTTKIEPPTKNKKMLKPIIIKARQEAWNNSVGKR